MKKGERNIYGIDFPDDLRKNQKLPHPVITPTTKAETGHDARLTREQIISKKIASEKIYSQVEKAALAVFKRGQEICKKAGIILVDTKYEFGLLDGNVVLIDEVHTPDSSRFWVADSYEKRFQNGEEPENFDKEFLRIWYKNHGYVGDPSTSSGRAVEPPKMPEDFVRQVSKRYIDIFEKITGEKLDYSKENVKTRIEKNMKDWKKKF